MRFVVFKRSLTNRRKSFWCAITERNHDSLESFDYLHSPKNQIKFCVNRSIVNFIFCQWKHKTRQLRASFQTLIYMCMMYPLKSNLKLRQYVWYSTESITVTGNKRNVTKIKIFILFTNILGSVNLICQRKIDIMWREKLLGTCF